MALKRDPPAVLFSVSAGTPSCFAGSIRFAGLGPLSSAKQDALRNLSKKGSRLAISIDDALGRRAFACFPVAVLAIIIAPDESVLLLNRPTRLGEWEVVAGALEASETIVDGLLREVGEELGPEIDVQPLATVHASTFRYDENVTHMISLAFVLAYRGGDIQPGDDMRGSAFRWWTAAELMAPDLKLTVPQNGKWLLLRAIELFRNQGRQGMAVPSFD